MLSDAFQRFVDRDMFMRYLGGGIGHKALRGIVRILDTIQILLKQGFKYRNAGK